MHTLQGATDWAVALDQLQATLPNVSVSLIVGWFGTDLRAGDCNPPRRQLRRQGHRAVDWSVAGLTRDSAHLISPREGPRPTAARRRTRPSSPPSRTSRRAASPSRSRPSSSWTCPPATRCPTPTAARRQPAYPWRGRITVARPRPARHPRQDRRRGDPGRRLRRHGRRVRLRRRRGQRHLLRPDEWSYRRFILHYAHLGWPPAASTPSSSARRCAASPGARQRQPLSLRRRAQPRRRREVRARPGNQGPLRRRLVGILRPPAG